MNIGRFGMAAMLAVASLGLTAPVALASAHGAPADAAAVQTSGSLPHGGSYILYRDTSIDAVSIGLWYRAPGAGYDNAQPGLSRVAATAAAAAKLESGRSLVEIVRSVGGRFSIQAFADIIGITALVPAPASRRVLAAMTSAYFAPSIDDAALKDGLRDAAVLAAQQAYSSQQLLHNVLFGQMFSTGAAHMPGLPNAVNDLAHIDVADATAFAKRAFRSGNAILSIAGNVDPSSLDAITVGTVGVQDAPIDSTIGNASAETIVPANVSGLGLGWFGPPIVDEKAATAMDFIADYLFRGGTGVVSKAVDADGSTYVGGQFITLHNPGIMVVAINGKAAPAAKAAVLAAFQKMMQPLDAATFDAARNAFLYHVAADLQVPGAESDNLGWYSAEGNATYAPSDSSGQYFKNARALDPAYIAEVAKRYLMHPVVVQLLSVPKESSS